jgi:hypothetical protein
MGAPPFGAHRMRGDGNNPCRTTSEYSQQRGTHTYNVPRIRDTVHNCVLRCGPMRGICTRVSLDSSNPFRSPPGAIETRSSQDTCQPQLRYDCGIVIGVYTYSNREYPSYAKNTSYICLFVGTISGRAWQHRTSAARGRLAHCGAQIIVHCFADMVWNRHF